jgi:hypothetical protein
MTLSQLGVLDFCLMMETLNRAWLGIEEMTSLSGDADLCWAIAGSYWGIELATDSLGSMIRPSP